ncbi:hypothetical protein SeMB42_g01856 [Synchytrium endobioticum]|uniref:F-box domain-containing protein n=1 Tax=Synchytrium endobioticum TaxID=286115 RepID=A0A507DIQ6_9FUNG|nr:hypothetical protein SeLEV6574_g03074 [Synchytrium endobioticum]TPX51552.1 hypothetical protein SeMB42_g01856 [Synchytrium endobioticum]
MAYDNIAVSQSLLDLPVELIEAIIAKVPNVRHLSQSCRALHRLSKKSCVRYNWLANNVKLLSSSSRKITFPMTLMTSQYSVKILNLATRLYSDTDDDDDPILSRIYWAFWTWARSTGCAITGHFLIKHTHIFPNQRCVFANGVRVLVEDGHVELACVLLEQATWDTCMRALVLFMSCAPARQALGIVFANVDNGGAFSETSAQFYIRAASNLILKPGVSSNMWHIYLAQACRLMAVDRERAAVLCLEIVVRHQRWEHWKLIYDAFVGSAPSSAVRRIMDRVRELGHNEVLMNQFPLGRDIPQPAEKRVNVILL